MEFHEVLLSTPKIFRSCLAEFAERLPLYNTFINTLKTIYAAEIVKRPEYNVYYAHN